MFFESSGPPWNRPTLLCHLDACRPSIKDCVSQLHLGNNSEPRSADDALWGLQGPPGQRRSSRKLSPPPANALYATCDGYNKVSLSMSPAAAAGSGGASESSAVTCMYLVHSKVSGHVILARQSIFASVGKKQRDGCLLLDWDFSFFFQNHINLTPLICISGRARPTSLSAQDVSCVSLDLFECSTLSFAQLRAGVGEKCFTLKILLNINYRH